MEGGREEVWREEGRRYTPCSQGVCNLVMGEGQEIS